MFARFAKADYWEQVGGVSSFHQASEKLGLTAENLDASVQGYSDPVSIWGKLAELTQIPNKHDQEAREWLYHAWREDRREVRSKYYAQKITNQLQVTDRIPLTC